MSSCSDGVLAPGIGLTLNHQRAMLGGGPMVTVDMSGNRDGYAEIGDVRLHYVEAGEGPLVVLLHGFPEFWFGWRLQIRRSRRPASASSRPTCAATTSRRARPGVAAYDMDRLAADVRALIHERGAESALLAGHDWGGSVAWATAMNHPEVVDRLAILNVPHPRQLPGPATPAPDREVLVLLLLPAAGAARALVHADAGTSSVRPRARRPPGLHAGGDRTLHRGVVPAGRGDGMINYYRAPCRQSPKTGRGASPSGQGAHPRHLGGTRPLPRRRTGRARPGRRPEPRARRAPARRLALGPSRRARARRGAARRVLRCRRRAPVDGLGLSHDGGVRLADSGVT